MQFAPYTCSNEILHDADRLQQRLAAEGYLFCRGLLDARRLLDLRRQILSICHRHGWVAGGDRLLEGIATGLPANEGDEAYFRVYDEVQRLEDFHSLAHEPALLGLMRTAVGPTAFPHPLGIVRLIFPDNRECTTPPHQDYPNNQGTPDLFAAWIPLGDCPLDRGGLAILEDSHRTGLLPLAFSMGPGGRQAVLPEPLASHRWLAEDMRTGDVLVFHSHTVHRALDNQSADRMRISCDFRYQRQGEPLCRPCLEPHFGRQGWEQVYAGWRSGRLQYYWRDLDFPIVEWDADFHALPDSHREEALREAIKYQRRMKRRAASLAGDDACDS